ncbi:MAG: adenylyltransferase/cytidyltransferase family protein [Actinobacteria bacterium]|nr:adenylyltransferase/cytidyltransferase family protein [Chloroflexota bacterium]MBE3128751.1 adenylyltransferase/cytidyltransferase family protein [Actinomycetota bacterium]
MDLKSAKKIKNLSDLAKIISKLKITKKKIVHCHGVFDLVHLGHIRHFNLAKKEGDILVVTLTKDKYVKRGPGRPIFNENLRAEMLASISIIDYVAIIDFPTAVEAIKILKPDFYVKGSDYKDKSKDFTGMINDEEEAVSSIGGKLIYTDDITFSSSSLINNFLDVYPPEIISYLKSIREKYTIDDISDKINSLKKLKVIVIGDPIIDQYHYCTPMGKSSKEHLVANLYDSEETFAGGSLATANHIANICEKVDLLTVLGSKNSYKDFISEKLNSNVIPTYFVWPDAETVVKKRFVSKVVNTKLFEICYLKREDIPESVEEKIMDRLDKTIKNYDLVVVNDFGHGLLTKNIIKLICEKSNYLALNVQTNSANIGFNMVTKYPRANFVCIDDLELRLATHDRISALQILVKNIFKLLNCEHIIATRGSSGSIGYSTKEGLHESPTFAYKIVDAIGAGDAFFSYVSPCIAGGFDLDLTSFIGNAAGSLATQIICNREPVRYADLMKFITRLLK